jgi:membrane protein implicated in regulation of membrane protease activity
MDVYGSAAYWLFKPEAWVILGIVLVTLDLMIGFAFFVLPVGIAAVILGAMIYAQANLWFGDVIIFETWKAILIWFAGLSLASIGIIKLFIRKPKDEEPDINQY